MIETYVNPIGLGFEHACMLGNLRQEENVIRQGRSRFASVLQMYQIDKATTIAVKAFEACGRAAPSSSIQWACFLAPVVVGWCAAQGFANLKIRAIVNFAHDHLGILAHIISGISLVVLLLNGQVLYATVCLGWLGIKALQRAQFFPEKISAVITGVGLYVGCCTGLYFGDWIDKVFCTMLIISEIAERCFKKPVVSSENSFEHALIESKAKAAGGTAVTYEDLEAVHGDKDPWEDVLGIEPNHMRREILPPVSDAVDPYVLMQFFDVTFDVAHWKEYEAMIDLKLEQDRRWKEVGSGKMSKVEYLRKELDALITGVMEKTIVVGPPSNYGRVQYYLRYITSRFPSPEELAKGRRAIRLSLEQVDVLLHLAVGGGTYCGAGELAAAANVFYSLLAGDSRLSFEDRIRVLIQIERQQISDTIYYQSGNFCLMRVVRTLLCYDWSDVHNKSLIVAHLNRSLGLMQEGAQEEVQDKISQLATYPYAAALKNLFLFRYTPNAMVLALLDAQGTPILPKQEIMDWWVKWCERNRRRDLLESLSEVPPRLGNIPFEIKMKRTLDSEVEVTRTNPFLIRAMLLDMGLIRFEPPQTSML